MISLCMITKDEERFLARCLSSVQPIVDEIIVVDTGSVDRTREIAGLFNAKVFDFEWTDDYSAARNLSLSKASGDWIFSLDADEVISERDHRLFKSLIANSEPGFSAYSFVTRNYTNDTNHVGWIANDGHYKCEEAGCGWVPTDKVRLFPYHTKIQYEYAVHEMVEPSLHREDVEIRESRIPIHHYGPLLRNKKDLKMRAYYRIGRKKLHTSGENVVSLYELAIQAAILGETAEAIVLWEKFIALKSDMPEAFVHLATAYFQDNNYHSALQASKKALELAPEMKEALYNYSLCEFIIGDIGEAIAYLEYLLDSSPEFLPARFLLAAAHICSGNKQKGRKRFKELSQTEMGPNLNATCRELAQRLVDDNRIDSAKLLIETSQGL